jgi:hypothetical protein
VSRQWRAGTLGSVCLSVSLHNNTSIEWGESHDFLYCYVIVITYQGHAHHLLLKPGRVVNVLLSHEQVQAMATLGSIVVLDLVKHTSFIAFDLMPVPLKAELHGLVYIKQELKLQKAQKPMAHFIETPSPPKNHLRTAKNSDSECLG